MVFGFNTFASAAFSDIGTLQFNVEVNVTGIGFTANRLGTAVLDANTLVDLTGQELTMQENAPTVIGDANVSVTGIGFTANLGTAVLDVNQEVDLTGQAIDYAGRYRYCR
jgi:hypothetical protein